LILEIKRGTLFQIYKLGMKKEPTKIEGFTHASHTKGSTPLICNVQWYRYKNSNYHTIFFTCEHLHVACQVGSRLLLQTLVTFEYTIVYYYGKASIKRRNTVRYSVLQWPLQKDTMVIFWPLLAFANFKTTCGYVGYQ